MFIISNGIRYLKSVIMAKFMMQMGFYVFLLLSFGRFHPYQDSSVIKHALEEFIKILSIQRRRS